MELLTIPENHSVSILISAASALVEVVCPVIVHDVFSKLLLGCERCEAFVAEAATVL